MNELEQRAKRHKKKLNGITTLNPDAGNVEHNVAMFNHMNSPAGGPSTCPNGPMAESLTVTADDIDTGDWVVYMAPDRYDAYAVLIPVKVDTVIRSRKFVTEFTGWAYAERLHTYNISGIVYKATSEEDAIDFITSSKGKKVKEMRGMNESVSRLYDFNYMTVADDLRKDLDEYGATTVEQMNGDACATIHFDERITDGDDTPIRGKLEVLGYEEDTCYSIGEDSIVTEYYSRSGEIGLRVKNEAGDIEVNVWIEEDTELEESYKPEQFDRVYTISCKGPTADKWENVYVVGYDYGSDVIATVNRKLPNAKLNGANPMFFQSIVSFLRKHSEEDLLNPEDLPEDETILAEAYKDPEGVEFEYRVDIECEYGSRSWDDGSYDKCINTTIDYTYTADRGEVEEEIAQYIVDEMTDEQYQAAGGDDGIDAYLDRLFAERFDELVEKYYDKLKDHFEDCAHEEAQEEFDPYDYEADRAADYADYQYHAWKDEMSMRECFEQMNSEDEE